MIALAIPAPTTLTNDEWLQALALSTDSVTQEAYNKTLDLVNNEGYPLDDIRDFVEEYGFRAYVDGHYETWSELTEDGYSMEAIEAFVEEWSVEDIGGFRDAYFGSFGSGEEFAQDYLEQHGDGLIIPSFVAIDWSETWENLQQEGYIEADGHIFYKYW